MHIPVLKEEAIKFLDVKPDENFIDATCGGGGHTLAILEKNYPKGKVLSIDADPEVIKNLKLKIKNWEKRIILVCDNFANLKQIVEVNKFIEVKGILFDLGLSSWHLDESGRGFSFRTNEPLDMRYNQQDQLTAEKILNFWSKTDLLRILNDYGEEKFSERIAQEIVSSRQVKPITSTLQLVEIIGRVVSGFYKRQKIHFATRTFQALRIAVNHELADIEKTLPQAFDILDSGGRMVIISFHSLEDRLIKNFFREKSKEAKMEILTKKPIVPSLKEIKENPRARSAKLRAAVKNNFF